MRFSMYHLVIIASALLVFASCKSKRPVAERVSGRETAKGQYRELSRKLNVEVTRGDNVKLYSYIADWLGTKHKLGGCDKSGIDCSCFIRMVSEEVYQTKLARTVAEMHKQSRKVYKENLREGDLVFFNIKSSKPSHVGIYLKQGWFAHVSSSRGVMINSLNEEYYAKHFTSGGRGG